MKFIDAYQQYASGNEASPMFHLWGALSTLSSVVSRKIWFDQEYFKIYPNIYVVLVGEPGDKKTTAMTLAREMAYKCEVPIAPPSATKEAITVLMSAANEESKCHSNFVLANIPRKITHLSFFASEIVTMLSAGGNPQGLIEFFTDIYDREAFEVLTKNKGNDIIDAPYITILACMTPEQTGQLLKEKLITGGFSRRCIFVYGRSKADPVPLPKLTLEQKQAKEFCIQYLKSIKNHMGEYRLTDDAREWFVDWYKKKHRQLSMPHPAPFKNWLRSKDTMLIKVAMLLDVSDKLSKLITVENLVLGASMLDATEKDLNRVFAGSGKNPLAELAVKVLTKIDEMPNKQMSKKQILTALFDDGDIQQITQTLDYLVASDQVKKQLLSINQVPVEVFAIPPPRVDP